MIFPEEFPKSKNDLSNEKYLYDRFKNELGKEFVVYYSVKLFTPDVPMREIDFLVISPRMILCIELKNGRWRYKNGKWQFYNRRNRTWEEHKNKPYKGPIEQIQTARKILKDFLYNHNSFDHPVSDEYFQSVIFFLKNEPNDFSLPAKEKKYFIGKSKLINKSLSMQDLLSTIQNKELPPLDTKILNNLHQIIRLNLNFAIDIHNRKKKQAQKLISLTREQFQVLLVEREFPHAIVLGVPGSGKTIIATETAFRLEANHLTTLFVTNSEAVANTLAGLARWFSVDFLTPETIEKGTRGKYQFLILDSSESYLTKDFLKKFQNILEKGWESGNWIVLGDWFSSLQKPDYREALEELRKYRPREVIWKKNIRTPQKVYEHACILGRKLFEPSPLPDITGIQYVPYSNEEEFFKKIEWSIQYGIRELKIDRESILILSLDPSTTQTILEKGNTYYLQQNKIFTLNEIESNPSKDNLPEGYIAIANLQEFKGREADYIIIVGIHDFYDKSKFEDYYQALTRCLQACAILYPVSLKPQLRELFSSSKIYAS